ncbi:chitin synthase regulatory factor [Coccidioides immitis RMSCC 3703]|uniref:Chitin synthase regulatory factor n=1 Tax=Coccidioides immitis RMSCC 3703 TaxID=454286 RepID=A0A0J8R569_COCIT|nr:chitin synthase regulatory factor [Coccidioides immitis RMSCC 3703]
MSRTAELQPPLSPPEPAYLRSSAPFPSPDHNPPPPPPPLMSPKNSSKHVSRLSLREIPKRKPVGLSELEAHESAVMHHSPVSPVRIDDPSIIPEASSALVEDVRNLRLSQESGNNYSYQEYPPRRSSLYQSPPPAQYSQDQHGPMDDTSGIPPRGDSLNHAGMPQQFSHLNGQGRQVETRSSSSRNSLESFPEEQESTQGNQEPEIYQPCNTRPLSFVDLMNVPYPQPPPAPATLSNAHLRASVGNSASLLSHKQTFEMYLANVKKTNDSGAQYEFAVFMIHAAQEASRPDSPAASKQQEIGSDISKAELLREAKAILQRLADRSYPYAQYYLGDGYASGLFNKGKPDYDKAFPLFVAASKHGHAEAGYRAALCYEFGWGSRKDGAKAVQFYRQAASKNHPGAMLRLGKACLTGDMGLSKRYREGITWLKRATESADFQYNAGPYELGLLHETGYGDDVFQDESYAAQLLTKSAELGHAESNYRLGDAYEHGKLSCPRDPALSVHFYTGAAQLGHPMAMMALCAWFMVGAESMLEKDEYEAYEWAKKAAECGLAKGEYAVGYFTEMGIGCRRDPLEANGWYVRAADHGDEGAKTPHRGNQSCGGQGLIPSRGGGGDPRERLEKPDPGLHRRKFLFYFAPSPLCLGERGDF